MPDPLPCLKPHHLKIVLVEPEIPQNTGNIARLCAVSGAELHLVRPLGFFLGEKHLKRAGLDYWDQVHLVVHDDLASFRRCLVGQRYWLSSAKGRNSLWDTRFHTDDWLVLGRETAGLPASWLAEEVDKTVRIPLMGQARCLNISTAAGIILFEALRQLH